LGGEEVSVSLEDELDRWQTDLRKLSGRLYVLEAFIAEFEAVRRGKAYLVWNDIVWGLMFDCNAMLVIDLASWVKGVCQQGGLLGRLRGQHAPSFPKKRHWDSDLERRGDTYIARVHNEGYAAAFARLFPDATNQAGSGFDGLRESLSSEMEQIIAERDQFRAHKYQKGKKGTRIHEVPELRAKVDLAFSLMADLILVGLGHSTAHEMDPNFASAQETAEDLVDAVFLGAHGRRQLVLRGRSRGEYYERRHREHDLRPDRDTVYFNDNWPEDEET
jgi:hypothetical protein